VPGLTLHGRAGEHEGKYRSLPQSGSRSRSTPLPGWPTGRNVDGHRAVEVREIDDPRYEAPYCWR